MKTIIFLALLFSATSSFAQEKSLTLVLYPEIVEVIELDQNSTLSMATLQTFCEQKGYQLLIEDFNIFLVKAHKPNFQIEPHKNELPEVLKSYMGQSAQIKNINYYGWEYLPSTYKSLLGPSKVKKPQ
ncbi:hypothetical protein KIH41_01330 [Litoribacter ruber]|uniref:hypothetical protein n=1 Tax=Litoribacter ruber TaxID=702568 RepID=UPI001BDA1050|nr:hypothetical protein [Litoribacter ruber]MBT0809917.1 hypothetical protein [Litoribacter ruber]